MVHYLKDAREIEVQQDNYLYRLTVSLHEHDNILNGIGNGKVFDYTATLWEIQPNGESSKELAKLTDMHNKKLNVVKNKLLLRTLKLAEKINQDFFNGVSFKSETYSRRKAAYSKIRNYLKTLKD